MLHRTLLLSLSLLAVGATSLEPVDLPTYRDAVHAGNLVNARLDEASGMASSRLSDDLLWVANDGGDGPRIYAVGPDGSDRGSLTLRGARNRDWEDLASFELDGTSYLMAADVGDNDARRETVALYVAREPELKGERLADNATIDVAWTIPFRYEDGPRDCEAVAVDPARELVLLLTKREIPPALYELPLRPLDGGLQTAKRMGRVATIPLPTPRDLVQDPRYGAFRSQPTALDISPDGSFAIVLTYKRAYLFPRRPDQTWPSAFEGDPRPVMLPMLPQSESLSLARDGRTVFFTSERRPAPLMRVDPE